MTTQTNGDDWKKAVEAVQNILFENGMEKEMVSEIAENVVLETCMSCCPEVFKTLDKNAQHLFEDDGSCWIVSDSDDY